MAAAPSNLARELRDLADAVDRGDELPAELTELAERLAKEAKHARFVGTFKRIVDKNPRIFAALAK